MNKEELRNYQALRIELTELEALRRRMQALDPGELPGVYQFKIEALTARLRRMEEAIEGLGPTERTLMRLRYIEGLSWQAICLRIHYSWQQTHRIHKNALIKIKEK